MRLRAILFLLISLTSCMSPLASIKPEIELFNKNYFNQVKTFTGKSKTMRYAMMGNPEKRPIVFVHGSPGSWDSWVHFLLDSELQKKFQLIAIDRPGYGGSNPGKPEISLAQQAADIIEVLQFNKSGQSAILVGHSFGGPVIAKMAMDFPQFVAGLVFVSSSVAPDLESTAWYQHAAEWWLIRLILPNAIRVCNQEILPLKGELEKILPAWKNISMKVAIIHGEADSLVPVANKDFLMNHLTNSQIIKVSIIPELNHFVPWKRPDLIIEAITEVNLAIQ